MISSLDGVERLAVSTPNRTYEIVVGGGLLDRAGELCQQAGLRGKAFLVSNTLVGPMYLDRLRASMEAAGYETACALLPDGEGHKRLSAIETLTGEALKAGLDRSSFVVALGGGVVCDVAGFFAAVFMRGVPLVQAPTSLEAQVDAAVGGKTAVNHELGKNLIGAFHQPFLVVSDLDVLNTLEARDIRAGMAEVVKCALIRDRSLFDRLEARPQSYVRREADALREAVVEACRIKAEIVARDERERGERALLNFGHTIGHALEACGGYSYYRHGEAVAIGMVAEARLSEELLGFPPEQTARIRRLLEALGLPVSVEGISISLDDAVDHMRRDKKAKQGRLQFALLEEAGRGTLVDDVSLEAARAVLSEIGCVGG